METTWYGNQLPLQTLLHAVQSDRLCHAYLFLGEDGCGKKTLARLFSMAILCKSANKPCLSCPSCQKMRSGTHPDFLEDDSKNARLGIKIDTLRGYKNDAFIKPNESGYQVFLIPNIQNTSVTAFNALLTVLEEPPLHTIFLLTATDKNAVPKTILSRCILIPLAPLSQPDCARALADRFPNQPPAVLQAAARDSAGNLGKAILHLGDASWQSTGALAKELFSLLDTECEYTFVQKFTAATPDKPALATLLSHLQLLFRRAILDPEQAALTQYQLLAMMDLVQQAQFLCEDPISFPLLMHWFCSQLFELL